MIVFEVNQKAGKKISSRFWSDWSKKISSVGQVKKSPVVSVAIVGTQAMKKMNSQYRGKEKATNVLSFAEIDVENKKFVQNETDYLGEVILCYPVIVKQARAQKVTIAQELGRLLTHGVLHLLGHDHQTDAQARKMERLEDKIIDF